MRALYVSRCIHERVSAQLRVEAFNVTNTALREPERLLLARRLRHNYAHDRQCADHAVCRQGAVLM
jgi:hypothetical protein